MPDSSITKKALAAALKQTMDEKSFPKISISDICEKCRMNRKSFYYHFRDKYDLVNWIFTSEMTDYKKIHPVGDDAWDSIEHLCKYFYENRTFYRKLFRISDQNCFSDYLHEILFIPMKSRLTDIMGEPVEDFYARFFCDAILAAIKRWLLDKNPTHPEDFIPKLKTILFKTAEKVIQR